MRKERVLSLCLCVFFLLFASACLAAETSSCINCHSNENIMKFLHKPQAMPEGEGEG
jgi:hypothetical protein